MIRQLRITHQGAIGVTRFERAASTSRTKPHNEEDAVNHKEKQVDPERLHQCLHQIGEWIENYGTESLADALVQLLGNESFEQLSDALGRRVTKG